MPRMRCARLSDKLCLSTGPNASFIASSPARSSLFSGLPHDAHHGVECGLWPMLPVEQERVARSSANRPVVEPGVTVADSPKRNAVDHVAVSHEDLKQLGVPFGEALLHRVREARDVRIRACRSRTT